MGEPTPALETGEDARRFYFEQVFVPHFFDKLAADFNIRPASEEQAERYLRMGLAMLDADARDQVKQAEASGDFLAEAEAGLYQVLGAYGYQPADPVKTASEAGIQSWSAQFAADPTVQKAALLLEQATASAA